MELIIKQNTSFAGCREIWLRQDSGTNDWLISYVDNSYTIENKNKEISVHENVLEPLLTPLKKRQLAVIPEEKIGLDGTTWEIWVQNGLNRVCASEWGDESWIAELYGEIRKLLEK